MIVGGPVWAGRGWAKDSTANVEARFCFARVLFDVGEGSWGSEWLSSRGRRIVCGRFVLPKIQNAWLGFGIKYFACNHPPSTAVICLSLPKLPATHCRVGYMGLPAGLPSIVCITAA